MNLGTAFRKAAHTRRGMAGLAVGLAAIGLAISAAFSGAPASAGTLEPGGPVPAFAVPRLQAIAARAVRVDGGYRAAWEKVVVTTHAKALESATSGDTPDPRMVVYLITIKGHFVLSNAAGAVAATTGSYLSLVVDAHTYTVMASRLSRSTPSVASLGPVTMLLR